VDLSLLRSNHRKRSIDTSKTREVRELGFATLPKKSYVVINPSRNWCVNVGSFLHSAMRFSLVYFTVHLVNATRKETSNIFNDEKTAIYKGFTKHSELENEVLRYCLNPQGYDPDNYGSIEDWDVSRITYMDHLFDFEFFGNITVSCPDCKDCNPNISKWNVSAVESFRYMFTDTAKFDRDIGDWDVSNASDFSGMFLRACAFNQDISRWDMSSSENFSSMFQKSPVFNGDISAWDVSKGLVFRHMFDSTANFDQNIGNWDVSRGEYVQGCCRIQSGYKQLGCVRWI